MTRREYHPVQGAYVDRNDPPDPFIASLRASLTPCPRCGAQGWIMPCSECGYPAPQHGPAAATWPGYTPQAQAYELATRGRPTWAFGPQLADGFPHEYGQPCDCPDCGPALDDGLPHEYGEPCECEGCQWPRYDAKVDA